MAKRGRKSLYTPEMVQKIVDVLALGASDVDAYTFAGINADTFYEWVKKHPEFAEEVTRARMQSKIVRIGRIKKHGETDWRADAWYLERRWPQEFAQQLIIKVDQADLAILKQMGFSTPAEAWQALMENARRELSDASTDPVSE